MGCCRSNLKLDTLDASIYAAATKRSRSGSNSSGGSGGSSSSSNNNSSNNYNNNNSSGLGSACNTTPQRNRSIWSRSQTRPICDDFAEQADLDRSCGYHTCSSAASTPSKRQLRRTQDMDMESGDHELESPSVGNLEWEMFMMQHAQRIMPKTSSPICARRDPRIDQNSRSYHKWRNYLQCTPAHMLHNVTHIPEAIAGHFCPIDFPAFTDLAEMESAAKRYKVDTEQQQQHLTHTISTDL